MNNHGKMHRHILHDESHRIVVSAKPLDVEVVSSNPTVYEYTQATDETLCETLVMMLSELSDKDMTELTPLHNAIDMDALSQILDTDEKATVSFGSNEYDITVSHKGRVRMIAS